MNRLSSRNQPNTKSKSNLSRLQRVMEIVFTSLIFEDTAVLITHYFKDSKISTSLDDRITYESLVAILKILKFPLL